MPSQASLCAGATAAASAPSSLPGHSVSSGRARCRGGGEGGQAGKPGGPIAFRAFEREGRGSGRSPMSSQFRFGGSMSSLSSKCRSRAARALRRAGAPSPPPCGRRCPPSPGGPTVPPPASSWSLPVRGGAYIFSLSAARVLFHKLSLGRHCALGKLAAWAGA